jgi:hypothetical protein
MPQKKIVQDILPSNRRSIREIGLVRESEGPSRAPKEKREEKPVRVPLHRDRSEHAAPAAGDEAPAKAPRRRRSSAGSDRRRGWLVGTVVILCLLALGFGASFFFASASVSIIPRSKTVSVDGDYSASVGASSPALAFVPVSTTTVASMTVQAPDSAPTESYATGEAVLVNASSPSTQTIITGTRLEDGRGLVYKTARTVVIPAATKSAPGTVAVPITASAPGASYDASPSDLSGDLSIVAWQGTARAEVFYGRESGDITGGTSGPGKSIASSTLAADAAGLSRQLSGSALATVQSLAPAGTIVYGPAVTVSLSPIAVTRLSSTTAQLSLTAQVLGVAFDRTALANTVAKGEIAQFPADNYSVEGLDSLAFAIVSSQKGAQGGLSSVTFSLDGALSIVGDVPTSTIRRSLAGVALSDSDSVLSPYGSAIQSARISITPPWIRTIPGDPDRISVSLASSTPLK